MNVTWSDSSRKVRFLGLLWSYLGKIFLSLTNKIQSCQRLKKFRRFRVFVLSYRVNSKKLKRRKSSKPSFQWQINEKSLALLLTARRFIYTQTSYSKKMSEMQELKTKWYFRINACLTMSHQNHFDYAHLSKPSNAKT